MIDDFWREKLAPLVERDLLIREGLLQRGILSDTYHKEMEKVHVENAAKLAKYIQQKGFPVLSNAGEVGVRNSWLIIQHAISLPDFMRECLTEMRLAAASGDYPLDLLAYTEDRVRFFEGIPQLYGTNCDWQEGELKPTTVEDPKSLNLRRKAVGLPPIESFTGSTNERPPKDLVSKEQEFKAWLVKKGWRS